jgi:unsaturated chondroitin disaccharide hydrolase
VFEKDPWAPTWSGGFLAGMMWLFADYSGDPWWQRQAETYCRLLEPYKHDSTTHDLGFILDPSWGRWYDRTHSDHARDVLIAGGRTMAGRLQTAGGYLNSWVDPASTFIDIMMNVGVILRAADYSGDDKLREAALRHCRTSRRYLVRGDGSTAHEGWFDTDTGEFLRTDTHQGWRSDSSWARGQSWAIYGFTTAYRFTGAADLLDTARRTADYYIQQTPGHGVPPNDWTEPTPTLHREASAAAITAAGMLQLATVLGQDSAASRYRTYALKVLATLRSTEYIAADTDGWQAILRHGTYHPAHHLGIDESVMFGDYYLVEALATQAASTADAGTSHTP